jgi:hypothetical protein
MAHFAKVENGIVTQVIVIEQDVLNTGLWGDPASWVQTSYNTIGGQHLDGRPLRKNFAGIGYTYDAEKDAFIPPKPYPSWVLDEASCLWNAPVAMPTEGGPYTWDELTLSWRVQPDYPTDGKQYTWDAQAWAWVEVVETPTETPTEEPASGV